VPSWLDLRLVLGLALVLASILLGASVVAGARHTSAALAARRDLAAGTVLAADDLAVVQVRLPSSGIYPNALPAVVGRQLVRPIQAGELLARGALDTTGERTTVTVPLAAAAAPDLHKGDRIELWLSGGRCAATVLLPEVTVQAVHADAGDLGAGSAGQDVVVSVPPELAERVITALALEDAQLRAGVLTGTADPPEPAPLPDLHSCAPASR
jgi:hypothetical protein